MRKVWLALGAAVVLPAIAFAAGEMVPSGQPVLNNVLQARLLVKSDTVPVPGGPTRSIYIGDAAACTANLVMSNDPLAGPVLYPQLQPGRVYDFRVKYLMSTSTTCTVVNAQY